jgi:Cu(I)/Ag(I) efflux system membrane fusion protein
MKKFLAGVFFGILAAVLAAGGVVYFYNSNSMGNPLEIVKKAPNAAMAVVRAITKTDEQKERTVEGQPAATVEVKSDGGHNAQTVEPQPVAPIEVKSDEQKEQEGHNGQTAEGQTAAPVEVKTDGQKERDGHNGQTAEQKPTVPIEVKGNTVTLDAKARQLSGLQTTKVAVRKLNKEINTTGKIAMNENGRTYITSRVDGRVDKLYVSDGEHVRPGQLVASVYSPTYIAAQEEYLLTLENVEKLGNAGQDVIQFNKRIRDAAKRKLQLLNVPDKEIAELEGTKKPRDYMPVYAQFGGNVLEKSLLPGAYVKAGDRLFSLMDISKVWVYADIYERDLANIKVGQSMAITSSAYPDENFSGRITFINPVLDDATRTIKIRAEMDNRGGKLKPNMFVNASVRIPLSESAVILESSLLDTGGEQFVFVEENEANFVRRNVSVGQYSNGYVQILSGLKPGEVVVTAAAFLLDSQTRLGNFGSHGGHGGGGGSPGHSGGTPNSVAGGI